MPDRRHGQRRHHSFIEACISTGIGFGVAFTANAVVFPLFFGMPISHSQNFWLTMIFTVLSIFRGYFVRRLFNYLHTKELL